MKIKIKSPKTRNPFVLHLAKRPSGAHGKPKKVERRDHKMALHRQVYGPGPISGQ